MDEEAKKTVRAIFQVAERNRAASEKLAGDPEMFGPRITLVALAIELYLKALLGAKGTNPPKLHGHAELFKRLPTETKTSIRARYGAEVMKPEVAIKIVAVVMQMPSGVNLEFDFDKNLSKGSEAFVKWRYSFDGKLPDMPTCYEICEALRQELISTIPNLPVIESTGDRLMLLGIQGKG